MHTNNACNYRTYLVTELDKNSQKVGGCHYNSMKDTPLLLGTFSEYQLITGTKKPAVCWLLNNITQ